MSQSIFSRRLLPALGCGLGIAATAQAQTPIFTFNGPGQYDRLGAAVSSAGDVNQDGRPDIAVGAPEDFQVFFQQEGFVRVYDGVTGAVLYTVDGTATYDQFGHSLDVIGDVNGDGRDDMVVGAPGASPNGVSLAGYVRVVSGLNGATLFTLNGVDNGGNLGWSVSGAGDVNGDGTPDFIAGAPEADSNGASAGFARVYSGVDGGVLWTLNGSSSSKRRGYSVSGLGDVNNDGRDDVIVGSLFDGVRICSGVDGSTINTFSGASTDVFGKRVCSVADVNGDTIPDIVIGATQEDVFSPGPGYVQVRSGANGAILWTATGIATGDRFGSALADAGDWNADGTPDVIVGADPSSGLVASYVRILSGVNGSVLATWTAADPADDFGYSVAGLGDTTGNTRVKVAVGSPLADPTNTASGRAQVFEGADGGAGGGCGDVNAYCQTSPNSVGAGAVISSLGSTSIANNDFILRATGCPANTNGIFYYGPNQIQQPFGNGFRCVGGGGIGVFRLPVISTNGSGTANFFLDYGSLPAGGNILADSTWNFQFWYRDPAGGGATFNLSNALNVNFCP